MDSGILVRQIDGYEIGQRQTDGFMNATAMCRANGKLWGDYWRLGTTQEFIRTMAESMGIPIDSLVEIRSGRGGGTWVHGDVAIDLARWLSPRFAVQVAKWVRELLTTGRVDLLPRAEREAWDGRFALSLVNHEAELWDRYPGGWTVVSELVNTFLAQELILREFGLPTLASDLPDGSVGKCYANDRDGVKFGPPLGQVPLLLPNRHREVFPLVYAEAERLTFRAWYKEVYLPLRLPAYYARKEELRAAVPVLEIARVADRTCQLLARRPAGLSARMRRQLDQAAGEVRPLTG